MEMGKGRYDLEERLVEFAAQIIRLIEALPTNRTGNHVANQLLRSGTSPMANHAEARSAESHADFLHKLKICLKELRESFRWLQLVQKVQLVQSEEVEKALQETDELVRIFVRSIHTVESKGKDGKWEEGRANRGWGRGNREPGTGNREQGTGNRERGTGNREPGTGNREQGTGNRE